MTSSEYAEVKKSNDHFSPSKEPLASQETKAENGIPKPGNAVRTPSMMWHVVGTLPKTKEELEPEK